MFCLQGYPGFNLFNVHGFINIHFILVAEEFISSTFHQMDNHTLTGIKLYRRFLGTYLLNSSLCNYYVHLCLHTTMAFCGIH